VWGGGAGPRVEPRHAWLRDGRFIGIAGCIHAPSPSALARSRAAPPGAGDAVGDERVATRPGTSVMTLGAPGAGWPLHWDCWVHPCTQPFRAARSRAAPPGVGDAVGDERVATRTGMSVMTLGAPGAGWPLHCRDCWVHPCTQPFRACALQGQTFVCPDSLLANPSNPRRGFSSPRNWAPLISQRSENARSRS